MIGSACGLLCNDCPHFAGNCSGCFQVEGKPFWVAEATATGICPLFDCAINKKGFSHCGECSELPCRMFFELKDPDLSESEHQKSIQQRIHNLRQQ